MSKFNPGSSMLEAALKYASMGWHVMPCYPMRDGICGCKKLQCVSPGKHPIPINGLNEATTDEITIRVWWTQVPDANIAVAMEKSGLFAFDLDRYHGDFEKFAALESKLGPMLLTVTQISGSHDGFHPIVKRPNFPVKGIIDGIVTRSKAYIIVAPSNHASGNHYTWQPGLGPDEIEVAELSDSWKEALRKTTVVGQIGVPEEEPEWLAKIPAEQRLADMKAHFAREQGEVKGNSAPGTTFNIVRSAIRSHAVRDSEAALEAALEFDAKCVPPWGARMARHVWSAYERATSPTWGSNYRGPDQRFADNGLADVPVTMDFAPETVTDLKLRFDLGEIAKKQGKGIGDYNKQLLKFILAGTYIEAAQDRETAIRVLVDNAPIGATDEQLVALTLGSLRDGDDALLKIRELRARRNVPSALANIGSSLAGLTANWPTAEVFVSAPAQLGADVDDLPPPTSDDDLRSRLVMGGEGEGIANSPVNLSRIMRWAKELCGFIRFNILTKHIEVTGGKFANSTENTLPTEVMNWLSAAWNYGTTTKAVQEQILLIAHQNRFNPIADYLIPLREKWDGVPRIDTWLVDFGGAQDTEFVRRVSAMWLISAVARGISPGAKVDTVLILEGRQGLKKSTLLNTMAGSWFSDTPLVIGNKDSYQVASSRWIIELAELSSLRSSETEAQKAFISARVDNYRPPYAAAMEEFPRFAIFGGSTNERGKYLIDPTGNRRYWPVAVDKCDIIGLRKVRDQLWAEAVFRYMSSELNPGLAHELAPGERWWFEEDAELEMAAAEVDKRRPENAWASIIRLWVTKPSMLGGTAKVMWTMAELAKNALDIEPEKLPRLQKSLMEAFREAGLYEVKVDGQEMWTLAESSQVLPNTAKDEPVDKPDDARLDN